MSDEQFSLKYRPKTLDAMVVGNPSVLTKARAMHNKSQAILIAGNSGTGKTTMGYIINLMLNGDKWKENLIEMNCSEERGIDDMRNLLSRLEYKPSGKKTVVLLDEVHAVTNAAASSLLKIMENPPHKDICFILCTDQPYKLLGSMVNRCRQLTIEPPSDKDLAIYIRKIILRQKLKLDKKVISRISLKIARAANCIPRMAMQLTEDVVDLLAAGESVKDVVTTIQNSDEANMDKFTGSVLIMLHSCAQGKAKPEEGIAFLLENMPSDAMGLLMRLQSANYYGGRMMHGGDFDWRGKVFMSAMSSRKLKPSLTDLTYITTQLNLLREQLKEPLTDPVILVGAGLSQMAIDIAKQ